MRENTNSKMYKLSEINDDIVLGMINLWEEVQDW